MSNKTSYSANWDAELAEVGRDKLLAEVKHLREQRNALQMRGTELLERARAAEADVERLRAELRVAYKHSQWLQGDLTLTKGELATCNVRKREVQAELERLRAVVASQSADRQALDAVIEVRDAEIEHLRDEGNMLIEGNFNRTADRCRETLRRIAELARGRHPEIFGEK